MPKIEIDELCELETAVAVHEKTVSDGGDDGSSIAVLIAIATGG